MSVRDVFERSDRWDSVGIDCARCVHAKVPEWPDIGKKFFCELHDMSLAVQVNESGRLNGEWFCKAFEGSANRDALVVLDEIRPQLRDDVLYKCTYRNDYLEEVPCEQVRKGGCSA